MPETLREVINKFDDLYTFSINKQEVFDRYTWEFTITDKKSDLYGLTGKLANYPHKIVTLRRGEHFFIAYKFLFSDKNVYFVVNRINPFLIKSSIDKDSTARCSKAFSISFREYPRTIRPEIASCTFSLTLADLAFAFSIFS